jgi:hypothetical protein
LEISHFNCLDIFKKQLFADSTVNHLHIKIRNNRGYFNGIIAGTRDANSCEGTVYFDHNGDRHENVYVQYQIRIRLNDGEGSVNIIETISLITILIIREQPSNI